MSTADASSTNGLDSCDSCTCTVFDYTADLKGSIFDVTWRGATETYKMLWQPVSEGYKITALDTSVSPFKAIEDPEGTQREVRDHLQDGPHHFANFSKGYSKSFHHSIATAPKVTIYRGDSSMESVAEDDADGTGLLPPKPSLKTAHSA